MFVFYLGITPPRPEDEKKFALTLFVILAGMTLGMIVITRLLLGAVFASGLR
jgi:hypothetical protein